MRIRCHHAGCGAVIELLLEHVGEAMRKTGCCCPLCGRPFSSPAVNGGADTLTQLAKALIALDSLTNNVGVELPAPVD